LGGFGFAIPEFTKTNPKRAGTRKVLLVFMRPTTIKRHSGSEVYDDFIFSLDSVL
jgi:hypothetical protein